MNQTTFDAGMVKAPRRPSIGGLFAAVVALATGTAGADMAMPDDGNTRATSTVIAFGIRTEASLEHRDDVDVFRIELQGRAEIAVQSGGTTDIMAVLSDSEGETIAANDDASATSLNFRIVETLDGGVYYLTVSGSGGATGPYRVLARIQRGGDDHGDTVGASTRITAMETAGSLRPAGDIDAFRIDVNAETAIVLRTKGPTDTVGRLQDSAGNVLAEADTGGDRGNFVIDTTLTPGIYYLMVSAKDGETGGYSVEAEFDGHVVCANPAVRVPDSGAAEMPGDGDDSGSSGEDDEEVDEPVYERFPPIEVGIGTITLAFQTTTGCEPVDELNLLGIVYTVLRSVWQRRADESDDWTDIDGTETTLELCAYSPTESGQYRLIADVEENGELKHYASNILTVE
ncbi:MAG: pre-peptidase C-terminal domain-containing protein [Gammaproteobacteria bacterium]|nr:pre-peptidase C-terminal domain-containing protein [Gammaproteobacteria bacterium]